MEEVETRFAALVERYADDPAVTPPTGGRGFGANGLKVGGKLFAFVSSEQTLVVKLPRARVDELVEADAGVRFDPGHGRIMKEWLAVAPEETARWEELADEARAFVGG